MIVMLLSIITYAQEKNVSLNGYIKDAANGELLIGATVSVKGTSTGAVANNYGYYVLNLPPGTYDIIVQFLGYAPQEYSLEIKSNVRKDFELQMDGLGLEEVVVSSDREESKVKTAEISVERLSVDQIKKLPQLLGEVDVIRTIQLLPGVSTVGEGATGFNVRGGNIDQNLVLLDEAPVYSSSHLLGFFSVFNADAVKDLKLYKGGIPANYGGRLSSVLDVRQKDGNKKEFAGNGGLGLISSRLTLEGPIQKDKSSFMISGRRSYLDVFTALAADPDIRDNTLYFYDLNAKVNFDLGEKDRLYVSGYFGNDVFAFQDLFRTAWGNRTGTLRWNHIFSPKLFANITGIYSRYDYTIGSDDDINSFEWTSKINQQTLKADFTWFARNGLTMDFGYAYSAHIYAPGEIIPGAADASLNALLLPEDITRENSLFFHFDQKIGKKWTLNYGLRWTAYSLVGPGRTYVYEDPVNRNRQAVVDTLSFSRGQTMQTYSGLEPRIAINYQLANQSAIKASYNRLYQYAQLISNTAAATPVDIWKPSNQYLRPAQVDQFVLGYFLEPVEKNWSVSAEVFYKKYENLVDFVDGASLLFNEYLEADLRSGEGEAYGLEIAGEKSLGNFYSKLSYTYSRSLRRTDGINDGNWYRANFDKPHELDMILTYTLNDKWDFGASFIVATGRPVTYPTGSFQFEGNTVPIYGARNSDRLPAYHRLDLSANLTPRRQRKGFESSWSFGLYNAYMRRNAYSVFFQPSEQNPSQLEAVRLSIFGTVIPSATYNLKF